MRLLILGGTWFLGRRSAEHAIEIGWQVTTFTRERNGHDMPGTTAMRGWREDPDDVGRLAGSGQDVAVDTSGYTPEAAGQAAQILRARAGRFVFTSTVNAYRGWPAEPLTDQSLVGLTRRAAGQSQSA